MAEYYRFISLLISIQCGLVVAVRTQSGSHSFRRGYRTTNPQDSELYNQIIEKKPSSAAHAGGSRKVYCYPQTSIINDSPKIVITKFEVDDLDRDGIGNLGAVVKSGGVGKNQVCITIYSRSDSTYAYSFKVYGY